jgi:hypothetical protein
MRQGRGLITVITTVLLGSIPVALLAAPASAAAAAVTCTSSSHRALAARLDRDIDQALRGRVSAVAVGVADPAQHLQCWLHSRAHFDSASVVKVTILSALLRKAQEQHRYLSRTEARLARAMITESDNGAASDLWYDVGRYDFQHFLNLARMTRTYPGPGPYWGLTQITAYDETLLLRLLLSKNAVLDTNSRDYVLGLMAQVIPAQRWGVPAGAPTSLTVHVKNGWLPLATHGWRIHSIGAFTGHGGGYSIVVLTQDNPTMAYGIDTIQAIARAINRDLNPGARSRVPSAEFSPSWGTPDEPVPAGADLGAAQS